MSWFEAEFALSDTVDPMQFNHVFVGLEKKVIVLVSDVLLEKAEAKPSMGETAKLNHLLAKLTLGDRMPSQLLPEMKQLGDDKVSTKLL